MGRLEDLFDRKLAFMHGARGVEAEMTEYRPLAASLGVGLSLTPALHKLDADKSTGMCFFFAIALSMATPPLQKGWLRYLKTKLDDGGPS